MKLKDMNLQQVKADVTSENTSAKKRSKTYKIEMTKEELIHLRDTCPNDLMNLIFRNDWQQNERLQIVRMFFNKRRPATKSELIIDKKGQTKLL